MVDDQLHNLRKTGAPLSTVTVRGIMVATLMHHCPEVFDLKTRTGEDKFRCSDSFIRNYLRRHLNYSFRRATRAAQKTPTNATEQGFHMFLRLASTIQDNDTPPELIINFDQTQVVYAPGTNVTWNERGAKQVSMVGQEDKRAFTLTPAVSPSGEILPFQAIYQGQTAAVLPKETDANSEAFAYAKEEGLVFIPSRSPTYWANFDTLQLFIASVVEYFERKMDELGLPRKTRSIIVLDSWSVHRGQEFRSWMAEAYEWISLIYVPANCTSLFQPCDAGIQHILKLIIKRAAHADIVNETLALLASGKDPAEVLISTSVITMRNRSLRWLVEAYKAFKADPELVKSVRLLEPALQSAILRLLRSRPSPSVQSDPRESSTCPTQVLQARKPDRLLSPFASRTPPFTFRSPGMKRRQMQRTTLRKKNRLTTRMVMSWARTTPMLRWLRSSERSDLVTTRSKSQPTSDPPKER